MPCNLGWTVQKAHLRWTWKLAPHKLSSKLVRLVFRHMIVYFHTFFTTDRNLSIDPAARKCGATASVAILHSLDSPAAPFFSSKKIALTVAHCGWARIHYHSFSTTHIGYSDTRVFLCYCKGGDVFAMTETHHADARVESQRLRRMMGSALTADSFGETRYDVLSYASSNFWINVGGWVPSPIHDGSYHSHLQVSLTD